MESRATAEELLPLVYNELRRIASTKLKRERVGITLQTTALVHEAYLKLQGTGQDRIEWADQEHFMRAASLAMRRILVDHARWRKRAKRDGGKQQPWADGIDVAIPSLDLPDYLLDLDSALEKLATIDPTAAEIVQLRYFAGMTNAQAAETLGISPRSADRYWAFARAWLFDEIQST